MEEDAEQPVATHKWQWARPMRRCYLHIWLHVFYYFDLVPRVIGRKGLNMSNIAHQTWAKLRVRGRGSLHFEDTGREADVPLMLAISHLHYNSFWIHRACQMALAVLRRVQREFDSFCRQYGLQTCLVFSFAHCSHPQAVAEFFPEAAAQANVLHVLHNVLDDDGDMQFPSRRRN